MKSFPADKTVDCTGTTPIDAESSPDRPYSIILSTDTPDFLLSGLGAAHYQASESDEQTAD